jgi:hypothetical protein
MLSGRQVSTLLRNLLPPSSMYEMKAVGSSEMFVGTYLRTTRSYIPEDRNLKNKNNSLLFGPKFKSILT